MEGSWLDHIPSAERRKLKQMMSPEAYERLRDKVKGPEDLERELKRAEQLAELSFEMQTNDHLREKMRVQVEKDMNEQGIEQVFDLRAVPPKLQRALLQGKFSMTVSGNPHTHHDQLMAVPEGHVQEKIPLKVSMSDRYVAQFSLKKK